MIDPKMWDDNQFVSLDDAAQTLWAYLLTGPESVQGPPGLLNIGISGLGEARRRSSLDIERALRQLVERDMVQIDTGHRIIRVVNAPFYRIPPNPKVVLAWFRRWEHLPQSTLKYLHIETMYDALMRRVAVSELKASIVEAFERTFGQQGKRPTTSSQKQRPQSDLPGVATVGETTSRDTVSARQYSSEEPSMTVPAMTLADTVSRNGSAAGKNLTLPSLSDESLVRTVGEPTGEHTVPFRRPISGGRSSGGRSPDTTRSRPVRATGQAPVEEHHEVSPGLMPFRMP